MPMLKISVITSLMLSASVATAQVCENGVCRIPQNPAARSRPFDVRNSPSLAAEYDLNRRAGGICTSCGCRRLSCTCGPDCASCFQSHQLRQSPFEPNAIRQPLNSSRSRDLQFAPQPRENLMSSAAWRTQIPWETSYDRAIAAVRRSRRPLLLKVGAEWCGHCQRMQRETFTDRRIVSDVAGAFVALKLDADRHRELVQRLQVKTLPTILVVSPELKVLDRQEGFRSVTQLSRVLNRHMNRAQLEVPIKVVCR